MSCESLIAEVYLIGPFRVRDVGAFIDAARLRVCVAGWFVCSEMGEVCVSARSSITHDVLTIELLCL